MARSTLNQILGIQEDTNKETAPVATAQPQTTAAAPKVETPQTPAVMPKVETAPVAAPETKTETPATAGATEATAAVPPKKTVEERMEEWKLNNPEPVRRTVEAPELTHNYDYKTILEKYQKDSQPDPKVEKQRKINQSIAAAGDALTALINAVGTTAGGNNMKLDPASGLSEKMRARYKADDATAQDLRDKYLTLMLKAAGLEDADNNRKLSLYNSAVAKADTDYNTAKRNHDTAYDRQVRSYERQDAAEAKAKANEATEAYRQQRIDLDNKRYTETQRHNKAMENKPSGHGGNSGRGNNEHFIIGEWRSNRTFSKEELATVASRMYEAGLISVGDWNSAEMGLKAYSPLIEKAARTKKGAEIMASNGFTKNK